MILSPFLRRMMIREMSADSKSVMRTPSFRSWRMRRRLLAVSCSRGGVRRKKAPITAIAAAAVCVLGGVLAQRMAKRSAANAEVQMKAAEDTDEE